jgi:hypothetical protein
MIEKAIAKILELAEPNMVEVNDRQYSDKDLNGILEPTTAPIHLHTLTGLLDWAAADRHDDLMLHVVDATHVHAISKLFGDWHQRNHYVEVQPCRRQLFEFGDWMNIENFIIKFQCGFVDGENKRRVLKTIGNIKTSMVQTSEDDGISQKVAMENEIQRIQEKTLEPMILLQPFRTFTEVTQPESFFLLRLRAQKDELPKVALFEADAGSWQNVAITNIADFLKDSKVVKELKIPVLS